MATPPLAKLKFNNTIVTPLAQITVIDANEGDCNVVDFCRLPLPIVADSWFRTIIDTGPGKDFASLEPNAKILASLKLVAGGQSLPAMPTDATFKSIGVQALQITHPDDDHIGNAAGFLKAMFSETVISGFDPIRFVDRIKGCRITYCSIPKKYEKPTITEGQPVFSQDVAKGGPINTVKFSAALNQDWLDKMKIAGLTPLVKLRPVYVDGKEVTSKTNTWAKDKYKWSRDVNIDNEMSLAYAESVVKEGTTVILKASVALYFEGDRNIEAVAIGGLGDGLRIAEIKKPMLLTKALPSLVLDDNTASNFVQQQTVALAWTPAAEAVKKAKSDVFVAGFSGLMSGMVLQRPLTVNAQTGLEGGRIVVRNVPQVQDLKSTIINLANTKYNDAKGSTVQTRLGLKISVPIAGDIISAKSDATNQYGFQRILGPTTQLYGNMMRDILLSVYKLDSTVKKIANSGSLKLDAESSNRSSVVTLFERPSADPTLGRDSSFAMLFTGDAFDKSCDIRDTLLSWQRGLRAPPIAPNTIKVDLLKVPHHGSDVTQSSGFYTFVRANTYLICGSHHNKHGNPKLSTLKAIVQGFKGTTAPGNAPYRIFFSSTDADRHYDKPDTQSSWRSCVLAIREDPVLKPGAAGSAYYYRMYKPNMSELQWPSHAAFGSICFGKTAANDVVVSWNATQWINISGIDP